MQGGDHGRPQGRQNLKSQENTPKTQLTELQKEYMWGSGFEI